MTDTPLEACRRALDEALAGAAVTPAAVATLAAASAETLDAALRAFADTHLGAALPVLVGLSETAPGGVKRAAKRALYRLSQRGLTPPPRPAPRPVVERGEERAVRAWISAIDGSGSRAMWLLFDSAFGGLELCSLIVNDVAGVLEVAGGGITKKRLATELAGLRAAQKLPWVETAPARVVAAVAEALTLHHALGTSPPAGFTRWQRHFEGAAVPAPPVAPSDPDPALVERGAEILDAPEMAGWFIEPGNVQAEAVELMQTQESRLVVSDQVKGEREQALVTQVVERELGAEARALWARRLLESADVFEATGRGEHGAIARAVAGALMRDDDVTQQPFARALAQRALEVASEVATGRLSMAAATRKPTAITR